MSAVPRRAILAMALALPVLAPAYRAFADAAAEAGQFVTQLVNQALALLANQQMAQADREAAFTHLLTDNFDIPRISRFVLGRYWSAASEDDRSKFIDTYRTFVIRTYAARFSSYSGETFRVVNTHPEGEEFTLVNSEIIHPSGSPPAKVAWRVHKGADGFKIVDIDVEGVSMMVTQREEFASVLQHSGGTVASLTQALQQKMQNGS
jgi:phospholipid transport system substrate-binding protein